jgi:ubiquinone/menaquinone biosynthesis C-methylase UbiE
MNIEDKRQMFAEVNRVLKPGGAYVFQEVLAGVEDAVIKFPVPWAKEANMSYLWDEEKIKNSILKLNMVAHIWKNATEQYLDEYRILAAKTADVSNTPVMGVHLMLGGEAGVMRRNVVSNLSQGLIAIYQGVFKKEK